MMSGAGAEEDTFLPLPSEDLDLNADIHISNSTSSPSPQLLHTSTAAAHPKPSDYNKQDFLEQINTIPPPAPLLQNHSPIPPSPHIIHLHDASHSEPSNADHDQIFLSLTKPPLRYKPENVDGEINTLLVQDGNLHPHSESPVTQQCSLQLLAHKNKVISNSGVGLVENRNNTIDGGLSMLAVNQIMTSHASQGSASQISTDEHTKSSVLEVLDSVSCTGGKWDIGDEFNKDISPAEEPCSKSARTKELGDASRSSSVDHSHEKLADSFGEVYAERMQHVPHAEPVTGFGQLKSTEKQVLCQDTLKPEISCRREHVASYTLAPEREGEFFVSDLVWGKVKSHPWWPGQIFDASDASERAIKYKRKDKFLVAYFGDQTFAWNKASSLHHFRTHFSQMEKQGSSESFRNAINYALDEVCRRVELGLVCSCTPKQVYTMVNSQVIENAGIRKEARRMDGLGNSLRATFFESGKLLQYIKSLASYPCGGVDRLELKIAQAQLLAFYRLKGYCQLPEFHIFGGLLEDDVDNSCPDKKDHSHEMIKHEIPVSHNNEHILYDKARLETLRSSRKRNYGSDGGLCPSRKKKRPSVLMGGKKGYSPPVSSGRHGVNKRASSKSVSSSGIKQKAVDGFSDSRTPQSFKVGECLRRIASQLTGSPPILKCSGERFQNDGSKLVRGSASENDGVECSSCISEGSHRRRITLPIESSLDEMLSQLCLAAVDPKKEYGFLTTIVGFFSDFRDSISLKTGIGIRKPDTEINLFDFEEKNDSYWIDRIIQSSPEEQTLCRSGSKKGDSYSGILSGLDTSPVQVEDPLQLNLILGFEEQNLDDDYVLLNEKPSCKYRKRKSQLVLSVDENTASDFELSCLGDHDVVTGNPLSRLNENKYVNKFSPTALSMSFSELDSIPSEMDLNKIFRRFGPLKESETEVVRDTKSAKVVFKKQTDAEVAFSSAAKFSIFGSAHVSYQLRY